MKIEELAKIDYNDHWLICIRYGEIDVAPKDPLWLRWVKTAFQVLTFYCFDVFGHMRINHVAQGLFHKFKQDKEQDTHHYIVVINKLLSLENPIQTHREELIRIKTQILYFNP